MIDSSIDFFRTLDKNLSSPDTRQWLISALVHYFIDPPVRKGNKTLPDANTHSIVKQNYVKKLKRKRKNIQYKKRERKKGKENYLPRQYSKSEFLHNCQFNQLQQVASSKKSFSCRSKKIVLIKYSLSFNWLN